MHASSDLKPTRVRSTSEESIETVISSSSESSDATNDTRQNIPHVINAAPQVMVINREHVYNHLSRCEVLRQTAQTYKDEVKDCYENGCCKCFDAPIARPDLNPHPQIQDCRVKCRVGCCMCLIGVGCLGGFGYSMIYNSAIWQS